MRSPTQVAPNDSLWRLAVPPATWFAHFIACYAVAVAWCGRWGAGSSVASTALVGALTAAAVAAMALPLMHHGHVRPLLRAGLALDDDSPGGRHEFVATAHTWLVLLATAAMLFVAGSTLLVPRCR